MGLKFGRAMLTPTPTLVCHSYDERDDRFGPTTAVGETVVCLGWIIVAPIRPIAQTTRWVTRTRRCLGFTHQLSELTTQLSETIGLAEARAKDEGRLRSELKRLQITAARWGGAGGDFLFLLHQLHWLETALMELRCRHL